jgi:hypothetical protein
MSENLEREPEPLRAGPFDSALSPPAGLRRRITLRFSQWYAVLLLGRGMGPGLGAVSVSLTNDNLRHAVPEVDPPAELLEAVRDTVYDSNPSEILGRANKWSAALQSGVVSGQLRVPPRTILTTYGLVSFKNGIRLSVIHYLEPAAVFRLRRRPPAARIDEREFPVVIRPAAFVPMSAQAELGDSTSLNSNIWLNIKYKKSSKLGYLTAGHAVKGVKRGTVVTPMTNRSPPPGIVTLRSGTMDSAVVRTDLDVGLKFKTAHPSSVIGYKPVRLITGRGEISADVVEHTGHPYQGKIPLSKGPGEPPDHIWIFLNRFLAPGDSGCLVVDCEHEQLDGGRANPYAMYLGAWNGIRGGEGYCQLLEQARRHWDLEFCEPWKDDDDRKPRVGY